MKFLLSVILLAAPCPSVFRPEMQDTMMKNMFEFYEQHEGKPYVNCIVENWLKVRKNIGYCEAGWEVGDLNSDGITNMEDFAIYAAVAK